MPQWIKYLLWMHEELSSDPHCPPSPAAHAYIFSIGGRGGGRWSPVASWIVSFWSATPAKAARFSERPGLSKYGEVIEENGGTPISGLYTCLHIFLTTYKCTRTHTCGKIGITGGKTFKNYLSGLKQNVLDVCILVSRRLLRWCALLLQSFYTEKYHFCLLHVLVSTQILPGKHVPKSCLAFPLMYGPECQSDLI